MALLCSPWLAERYRGKTDSQLPCQDAAQIIDRVRSGTPDPEWKGMTCVAPENLAFGVTSVPAIW